MVAFNDRDPHSMLYKKMKRVETLLQELERLWNSKERFVVVSIRIYDVSQTGAGSKQGGERDG